MFRNGRPTKEGYTRSVPLAPPSSVKVAQLKKATPGRCRSPLHVDRVESLAQPSRSRAGAARLFVDLVEGLAQPSRSCAGASRLLPAGRPEILALNGRFYSVPTDLVEGWALNGRSGFSPAVLFEGRALSVRSCAFPIECRQFCLKRHGFDENCRRLLLCCENACPDVDQCSWFCRVCFPLCLPPPIHIFCCTLIIFPRWCRNRSDNWWSCCWRFGRPKCCCQYPAHPLKC